VSRKKRKNRGGKSQGPKELGKGRGETNGVLRRFVNTASKSGGTAKSQVWTKGQGGKGGKKIKNHKKKRRGSKKKTPGGTCRSRRSTKSQGRLQGPRKKKGASGHVNCLIRQNSDARGGGTGGGRRVIRIKAGLFIGGPQKG